MDANARECQANTLIAYDSRPFAFLRAFRLKNHAARTCAETNEIGRNKRKNTKNTVSAISFVLLRSFRPVPSFLSQSLFAHMANELSDRRALTCQWSKTPRHLFQAQ